MSLSSEQMAHIQTVIIDAIRKKLTNYKPESNSMPFHYHLLGKDRMALYSFIQSLNTTFGVSIFEPVAVVVAKPNFQRVEAQYSIGREICEEVQGIIQSIMNSLSMGTFISKADAVEMIRSGSHGEKRNTLRTVKCDLYLEAQNGACYLIDIKTAKPNISSFKDHKRTLLEWCGVMLTQDTTREVHSLVAMPYNPYHPKPYERWTLRGMLDLDVELKVGEEFWDFLGGENTYSEVLDCFEKAGIALRPELDAYFNRYREA